MADATLMKIGWRTLTGIVLVAGASGATVATVASRMATDESSASSTGESRQRETADRESEARADLDNSPTAASPEDLARALALLQAHLANPAEEGRMPRSPIESAAHTPATHDDVRPSPADSWEQAEGESAADALARLEDAYRAELERTAELEEEAKRERDAQLAKTDELERLQRELDEAQYLAERDALRNETARLTAVARASSERDEEDDADDDDQPEVTSVSQYAMTSAIYAPVFIGSAAPPPPPSSSKTSTPAPYPVIPRGAFFGVTIPQSRSSSGASSQNQAEVSVSYRPGQARSPWAPIDMSRHNNPWAATPGLP